MQQLFRKASETISKDLDWNTESKTAPVPLPDWSVAQFQLLFRCIQSGVEWKYFDMESGTHKQMPSINFRIIFPLSENY